MRRSSTLNRTLASPLLLATLALIATAQTKKVPCYSGDPYPSCTPLVRSAKASILAKAKTAAVIIEATRGISCGDGSDGCFQPDSGAVSMIQNEVNESELWQNVEKVEAKKADILLKFQTSDRRSLTLCAYNADSNTVLWCEYRSPSIALDNDAARAIAHFLEAKRTARK